MSGRKILFKMSGSIAAYKAADLISKLVQDGHEVQTIATPSAMKFIGSATLEGLTGKPVLSDLYESGKMMGHIDLDKWADIVILSPATANTINRLAQGLGSDLLTALFLAHDWRKPYIIAPAMNTRMLTHPATQAALEKLKSWGVTVLPTQEGNLACGDIGPGRMLEPEAIYERLNPWLRMDKKDSRSILITAGGTREPIDAARFISNVSTGGTGAALADHFYRTGWEVTYLHGEGAQYPETNCEIISYGSTADLQEKMNGLLKERLFHALLHLAAVSDYRPVAAIGKDNGWTASKGKKLASSGDNLTIKLERTPKIVESIRRLSNNPGLKLVAFKFTAETDADVQKSKVADLLKRSHANWVVHNDVKDRERGQQVNFQLFDPKGFVGKVRTKKELGILLETKLSEVKK